MFSDWGFSWGGWLDNRRGEWWLLAQLLLITAHLLPAWPAPASFGVAIWPKPLFGLGLLLLAFGLFRALEAFRCLGTSLSPLPAPKPANRLIATGAYAVCRHPCTGQCCCVPQAWCWPQAARCICCCWSAWRLCCGAKPASRSRGYGRCIRITANTPQTPRRLWAGFLDWTGVDQPFMRRPCWSASGRRRAVRGRRCCLRSCSAPGRGGGLCGPVPPSAPAGP